MLADMCELLALLTDSQFCLLFIVDRTADDRRAFLVLQHCSGRADCTNTLRMRLEATSGIVGYDRMHSRFKC
jgi:hypothetical protein